MSSTSGVASSTVAASLASATGLNSGLAIDDIITKLMAIDQVPIQSMQDKIKTIQSQQSAYSSIQGKVSDLLNSLRKLTDRNFDGTSSFDNMTGVSSDNTIVSATATAMAAPQSLSVEVLALPSSSTARSVGSKINSSTALSTLGINNGSFTITVDGVDQTVDLSAATTLQDAFDTINTQTGLSGSIDAATGKVSLAYPNGSSVTLGQSGDSSNFLSVLHLDTGVDNGSDTITASQGNSVPALVGKFDSTSTLASLGTSAGNFTIYVNGVAKTIDLTGITDMQGLFSAINTNTGLSGSIDATTGKTTFTYTPGTIVSFGSGSDTSNILAKLHLNTAIDNGSGTITASQGNSTLSLSESVSSAAAGFITPITAGSQFTINGVTFDTTGKSLNQIMTDINGNSAAKVSASFNPSTNSFELKSKTTGSALISMADTTGNFLQAMHLVNGTDTASSQTAGQNAQFKLNGAVMYSTSLTVDSTVTGLNGVTLNLKKAQVGTTVDITIKQDTDTLKTNVQDVITKYNTVVSLIDQQTSAGNDTTAAGTLAGDSRLRDLRNSLRSIFTAQVGALAGTKYDSLPLIGISTGAVGTGTASKGSPQLQFDATKFDAAMAADPNAIRKLLIGQDLSGTLNNTSNDDNMQGILTQINHLISDKTFTDGAGGYGALYSGTNDSNKGLFASYQASAKKKIDALNESITRGQDRLDKKEQRLRQQYQAMDELVGQYNQQGSALSGLINSLNASK
jgi:flagellar hook-associated protein 2